MDVVASIALFDFGDVLASWDPIPRTAEFARRAGLSSPEVQERLATDDFWANTDRGLFSGDEIQHRINDLLGCNFTREELLRLQAMVFTVRPEVVSIAEAVSQRTPVGILTNNNPLLEEALPNYFPELMRLFDPILFSFKFGHVKPERELFESAQVHLGRSPGEILFVDDIAAHVSSAASIGWEAVQYRSPAELRWALIERGLIEDIV